MAVAFEIRRHRSLSAIFGKNLRFLVNPLKMGFGLTKSVSSSELWRSLGRCVSFGQRMMMLWDKHEQGVAQNGVRRGGGEALSRCGPPIRLIAS